MKVFGIIILAIGLALGAYSLTMEVGIEVPARDYGEGVTTPAMQVANIDRMGQRQNYMIFSGILSIVGSVLLGFGSMARRESDKVSAPLSVVTENCSAPTSEANAPSSFSICPSCRHMGSGDATECARCHAALPA